MLGFVADSEYGIPRRCPCGRLINEVRGKENYDTLPGKRFFTCKNYEADGFHYRQPWVIGVQEELERLTKRVEEAEQVMMGVSNLTKQIETLEEQVKILNEQVYDLTLQVDTLEKADGFHYRQPWVIGVQEELERLTKRVEEAEQVMMGVSNLTKQIETLEDKILNEQVYDLTVQVDTLEKRWGRVNEQVCKFVGCHEAALKEQASGHSENDVMKAAHDIFFNDYKVKFTLEHCWRELRFDQKWRSHTISKEKRKEADAEVVPEEEEVRPPGIKASKAAKRKKPNEAAFD
ncbi:hypothetical protein DY000_02023710 [Brassica cretica]|uniref:Zinc finger GRF-type domain-containing protein n=1 Tax=Brassica cretica TaxID=69181 RepID=A0ABQ7EJC4_BRACR|nr:hypothetical protein DY000_02023710 [Brassica cretica]